MKKASRILAVAIALCMVLSLGAVSYAAQTGASWTDYQDYLYNASVGNAPDAQEWHDQVYALSAWEDIDLSVSPWDMIFSDQGPNLTTWAEFQATGSGVGSAVVGSTMDASGASGETAAKDAGVPSADKSSGVPSGDKKDAGVPSGDKKDAGMPAAEVTAAVSESIADMTVSDYATLNNFGRSDAGFIYVGYDVVDGALTAKGNWTGDPAAIALDNEVIGAAFTAVHASGAASDVSVTGTLILKDGAADADGAHASDFSGTGCAIVAANGAKVTAKDLTIVTDGFVRAGLILDNECIGWVENSDITTYGADPLTETYAGYENSANTGVMLSPPWVLGIQGGIRTINVLDNNCTLVVKDSRLASGGWGVISTDGCTTPSISVIDSELEILSESEGGMDSGWALYGYDENAYGSGYGAYIIGNTDEKYYGSAISGTTFGAIAREGSVSYQSSNGDIALTAATGEDLGVVTGKGAVTTIDSVFGCMTHSSEDTTVAYLDGTVVNTEEAIFLYRTSGHANFSADNAQLNSAKYIILQMMDDDDTIVGGFSPFNEFLYEDAGMPSVSGNQTGDTEYCEEVNMTLTNGEYRGDYLNGTGYYGQAGDVLNLTIGEGAWVSGAVALTETFHGLPYSAETAAAADALAPDVAYVLLDASYAVTDNAQNAAYIQFTQFSIRQYYMLCHVLNRTYWNGYSGANVTVAKGGEWHAFGDSLINYLKVEDGALVYGVLTQNADGTLSIAASETELIPAGEYGAKIEANVAASTGMGNVMGSKKDSGMPSGDKASGTPSGETDKTAGVPSADKTAGVPSADKTAGVPAAAAFTEADYAAFTSYFNSMTGSVPPDVPNYEEIQNMKLDDYSSLDEAYAAIDAAVAIPDLSGISGEMAG